MLKARVLLVPGLKQSSSKRSGQINWPGQRNQQVGNDSVMIGKHIELCSEKCQMVVMTILLTGQ